MRLLILQLVALCGLLLAASLSYGSDLKITHRFTSNGGSTTSTRYIRGQRSRQEFQASAGFAAWPGGPLVRTYGHRRATIYQCDERRVLNLDLEAQEYMSFKLNDQGLPTDIKPQPVELSGGTLTVTIEGIDTGERKMLFGHTARHIVTKERHVAGPGAVSQSGESERDGWYIDLSMPDGCRMPSEHGRGVGFVTAVLGRKIDKIEVQHSGVQEIGFPLELTTISRSESALPNATPELMTSTLKMEVIELSTEPLDPALFELPPGFKEVRELRNQTPSPPPSGLLRFWAWLRQSLSEMLR